jgi:ABC-2 type transport system permease protein
MPNLLLLEWMKLKYYRVFWIMTILFAGLLSLFYIGVSSGIIAIGTKGLNFLGKAYNFSSVWGDLCFFASYFVILLAILVAILTTNEYQYRTNRQNVIDGWTRLQFYHAKWQVVLTLSVGTTLFTFLLGLVCGVATGIPISTVFESIDKVLWLFLSCLDYLGFALLLSLLLKRSGIAIGILMSYSLIFESIIHAIFIFKYNWFFGDLFLPLQCCDELLPSSASRLLKASMTSNTGPTDWSFAIATLCWVAVYYIVGRWRIIKGDW